MSNFTAIAAVSETLKDLIALELGIAVDEKKTPQELSSVDPLVSLYLYRVEPNPFLNNLDWKPLSATQLGAPPFGLNLYYLITPYGPDQLEIQRTLGELLRLFHEQPVIRPGHPALKAELASMTEELRIVPHALPVSDMFDLWRSFDKVPYRLAVTYEVSAILVDSQQTRNVQRVQEREIDVATLR